ncbi:hypothetical protein GW17_00050273 [Ensete ventricosum]|nr:hypothetical protein GW17_00050273 [Ensete ventricosum]
MHEMHASPSAGHSGFLRTYKRAREKSTVGGRLREKNGRRGKEVPPFPAFSSPTPSPPTGRLRVFAALARWQFFSRVRRQNVSPISPRREIDRGDVVGTRIARYRAVPLKIDRRQSIEGEIDRRQSIEGEKGMKKKKRKTRKKEKWNTYFPASSSSMRRRRASSLPAGRQLPRAVVARGSRALFLLREEKGQGDVYFEALGSLVVAPFTGLVGQSF